MNEEQARLMVIAELARDIYAQMMSRDIPYANPVSYTHLTLPTICSV